MKYLVLVRHGESELNAINKHTRTFCGQRETPLTALGREQARLAGRRLASLTYLRIRHAQSSGLQRACDTLRLLLDELAHEVDLRPASPHLNERSLGVFEGRTEADVLAAFPEFGDRQSLLELQNHFVNKPPGGENLTDVTSRAWPVVEELMAAATSDVLVVSHFNTIRCILGRALELSPQDVRCLRVPNAVPIVLRRAQKFELVEGLE